MLLEFRTSNYKSFRNETTLSLIPAPKQTDLAYSILRESAGRKKYEAISSAVIYGANASGKSNMIGAMDTLRNIVLRGNIRNDEHYTANAATATLELIPNNSAETTAPVTFAIRFVSEGTLFDYQLALDIGTFLADGFERKILSEKLYVNNAMIFERAEELHIGTLRGIETWLVSGYRQNAKRIRAIASANLDPQELFLTNGFKNMFSSKLAAHITDWMSDHFMVIYRSDAMHLIRRFADPAKKSIYVEKTLTEAASVFGINSNALGYMVDGEGTEPKLCSVFHFENESRAIPANVFESYGTIRFVNLFPLVVKALMTGSVLVVDEFDASIHPMALMNIINIFHNDELNVHHAQLIFNTHNPIFLNGNLFRRDEIKFVERDEQTHFSSTYSLSDFGTSGTNGVRKGDDYMRNYFVDRYGAIRDIDFTSLFEKILRDEGGV